MIRTLKLLNAGLWTGLAVVGLGGLPLLSAVHRLVGMEGMPLVAAAALAAAASGSAWAFRRRAQAGLRRRLQAADRACREGLLEEAEEILGDTLSRLEGAAVSPAARRRIEREIAARLARLLHERPRPAEAEDASLRPPPEEPPRPLRPAERRLPGIAERAMEPEDEEVRPAGETASGSPAPTGGAPPDPLPAVPEPHAFPASSSRGAGQDPGERAFRFPTAAEGLEEEEEEPPPTLWERGEAFRPLGRFFSRSRAAVQAFCRARRVAGVAFPFPRRRFLARSGLVLAAAVVLAAGGKVAIDFLQRSPAGETFSGAAPPPPAENLPAALQPYTLQVAAYLKEETALRRVEELKQRGLEAYLSTAERGGKRWYQVRISHFADPQSAREAGRALREKGWIEDFYVANTAR